MGRLNRRHSGDLPHRCCLTVVSKSKLLSKRFIEGRLVVHHGKVLTPDHAAAPEALTEAQGRVIAAVRLYDWAQHQAKSLNLPMIQRMN